MRMGRSTAPATPPPALPPAFPALQNNDATFDKFQSLHTGDKYVDALSRTLQAKNEAKKKQVAVAPFKAASPMKKSAGLGDYYGTISGKTEYVPVRLRRRRAEDCVCARVCVCAPPCVHATAHARLFACVRAFVCVRAHVCAPLL